MQRMPDAQWECWTPALAKKVNENHPDPAGRHIDPDFKDQLKRDMLTPGGWDRNSAALAFTWDGICVDGHHRMAALEECGDDLPEGELWLLTVRGVDYDSRDTIDTGRPRTAVDFAKMHDIHVEGISDLHLMALAYRIWLWRIGIPVRSLNGVPGARRPKASPRELARVVKSDKLIPMALKRGKDLRTSAKIGTGSVNAMAYWLMSRVDDGMLEDVFWPALMTGQTSNRSIVVCRDRLIRAGKPSKRGVDALTSDAIASALVTTWNAVGKDKAISEERLLPANGVVNSKNFPEPLTPLPGKANPRLFAAV